MQKRLITSNYYIILKKIEDILNHIKKIYIFNQTLVMIIYINQELKPLM